MSRIATVLAYVAAMFIAAILGVAVAAIPFFTTLPECPTEDSVNCVWNAANHGNGIGNSFVTFHFAGHDVTIYTTEVK